MAGGPNLFARLHTWATRQDENFLTESLAVVLEHLLVLAPTVGTRLICQLTGGFIDVPAGDASAIQIRTQIEAGKGRPDLEICTSARLTWIEVKVESALRTGQLEGYQVLLAESGFDATKLVLLSRYPEAYTPEAARPEFEVRWYEVADWIDAEYTALSAAGEIAVFVAQQFVNFLRERGMTLTQVDKYLPEGLRALSSLLNMLMEAAVACKASVRKSTQWDYIGISLDRKYWVGILLTDPEKLWFATYCAIDAEAATQLGIGELTQEAWVPGRNRWWRGVELDSEEVHFFSRTKISQMQWLHEFMQDSLVKARSIEAPGQPPPPQPPNGD